MYTYLVEPGCTKYVYIHLFYTKYVYIHLFYTKTKLETKFDRWF